MENDIALIGFGEAARAFINDRPDWLDRTRAYDRKTDAAATRGAKCEEMDGAGVEPVETSDAAVAGAATVLSLVTADQALEAARTGCAAIAAGALWLDMNSVAPDTKRAGAAAIEDAGGRYIDVAVMAPVLPKGRAVPILLSGTHADAGAEALCRLGFSSLQVVAGGVGAASAIKMIRSVMIKGIEALTTECVLAAERAGVREIVMASLDASWPGADWNVRADYNLDRMMAHGLRRAVEMDEVVKTLDTLGTGSAMARATAQRQREIGSLRIAPPAGLDRKLAAMLASQNGQAA